MSALISKLPLKKTRINGAERSTNKPHIHELKTKVRWKTGWKLLIWETNFLLELSGHTLPSSVLYHTLIDMHFSSVQSVVLNS